MKTCDMCHLQGKEVQDTLEHALAHCALGEHCTSTTASCAAEAGGYDHPSRCCVCKAWILLPEGP
jgi:hypothetical protein